jgi:hypothetical protein
VNGSGSVTVRHRPSPSTANNPARGSEDERARRKRERERERERGETREDCCALPRVSCPLSLAIFCALSASFPAAVTHLLIGFCSFSQICALRRPKHACVSCTTGFFLSLSLFLSERAVSVCVFCGGLFVHTLAVVAVAHFKLLSLEISARCLCVCCVWWKEVSKPFFFFFVAF